MTDKEKVEAINEYSNAMYDFCKAITNGPFDCDGCINIKVEKRMRAAAMRLLEAVGLDYDEYPVALSEDLGTRSCEWAYCAPVVLDRKNNK
ncbi:MAG: hypothetical protein KBT06_04365 [Prevotellaceae bacterium]|nr:hypothetical protein [Candidatus Colivivens equi]